MANSVDPDQMPHSVASDLGLHCLPRPICPDTWGYYGMWDRISIYILSSCQMISCQEVHDISISFTMICCSVWF